MPKSLRQQIMDNFYEVAGHIENGECFYEESMLNSLIANLDNLRTLSIEFYAENKANNED